MCRYPRSAKAFLLITSIAAFQALWGCAHFCGNSGTREGAWGLAIRHPHVLGTGKWLAGPSALGVYLGSKWKLGGLMQQYWDVAGDSDRDDVNMINLQYFYIYSLDSMTSIGAAPNILINWEQESGNKLTLPVPSGIFDSI